MTSDDQQFLATLGAIPFQIRRAVAEYSFVDAINRSIDETSNRVRGALESATWLPESIRPRPPTPPPRLKFVHNEGGVFAATVDWVDKNRVLFAATTAFLSTWALLYYRRRRAYVKKRRARRTKSGARCEVVVVAGSLGTPMSRSIILDLERRGFIVYVATDDPTQKEDIKSEGKPDILPLHLDITNPLDIDNTTSQFRRLIRTPQRTHDGSEPHHLSLAGLVIIPDLVYSSGPVETIPTEFWSDEINTKLLGTVITAQAFLSTLSEFRARLLLLTPTVVASLKPPFQSVESTIVAGLEGFATSLQSELATVGVNVYRLRVGNFDCGPSSLRGALASDAGQEVLTWSPSARSIYAQNYLAGKDIFYGRPQGLHGLTAGRRNRGSHLRELNNAVFDTLVQPRPWSVQRVGQGSVVYGLVGAVMPSSIIRNLMGIRAVDGACKASQMSNSVSWETISYERDE